MIFEKKTVTISDGGGGHITINEEDFDEKIHKLVEVTLTIKDGPANEAGAEENVPVAYTKALLNTFNHEKLEGIARDEFGIEPEGKTNRQEFMLLILEAQEKVSKETEETE